MSEKGFKRTNGKAKNFYQYETQLNYNVPLNLIQMIIVLALFLINALMYTFYMFAQTTLTKPLLQGTDQFSDALIDTTGSLIEKGNYLLYY